ncbi:MAG: hypothetical protein QW782_08325 [Candidatus Bathyarchaeia archaeon]
MERHLINEGERRKRLSKTLFLMISILSLLLVAALITFNIGPEARRQQRGPYRIFPRDTAHWFGWVGLFIFAASASYSALKRGFPKSIKTWLLVHCITGALSMVLVTFHIINKIQAPRPGYFISFFAFLLMAVIVVSGMLGRYVKIKFIKDYWRTLHIPLTIIFYFTLAFHILEKINLLW